MKRLLLLFVCLFLTSSVHSIKKKNGGEFSLSTDRFSAHTDTTVVAFADMNSDKTTDFLLVSQQEGTVRVVFGGDDEADVKSMEILKLTDASNLQGVVPADFDGDLINDLLLIHGQPHGPFSLQVCFGSKSTSTYHECTNITGSCRDQPLILDSNGDMRPDILVEAPNLTIFTLPVNTSAFVSMSIDNSQWGPLLLPQSSAFADMNGNLASDVILTAQKGLAVVLNKGGTIDWTSPCIVSWPDEVTADQLGMLTFSDFDSDAHMDVLTSYTSGGKTVLYTLSGGEVMPWLENGCQGAHPKWNRLTVGLVEGSSWTLSSTDSWLRAGDVDNDGYFDLLVTLVNTDSGESRPFILLNTDCNGTCTQERTFTVQWQWLPAHVNTSQVAFFDMYHNGMLDILYNADLGTSRELYLLTNNVAKQSCFVSVKVGSGLCSYTDESKCNKPYTNVVGPTIQYNSTHPDGSSAASIATQLSQCTNGALLLPYVQFGLGSTPNFVDSLTVGVPRQTGQEKWKQTWKTIIPNSHLVVVPRPLHKPDQWFMHLYVTPSHMVLVTGLVMLGLCSVIALIIAALHIKEKYQDKKVKLQESHRFHFNAM